MGIRKYIAGVAIASATVVAASQAYAVPTKALYLTMDGSGSIGAADFTTQISAYVNSLNAVFTAAPAIYGTVAIGGGIFGEDFAEFFAVQTINNAADLALLTGAISALDPGRGGVDTGSTAIGDALTASSNALLAFEVGLGSDLELIIDVTTDGGNNFGSDPATVAGNLTPAPIDAINCLEIGSSADCSFVTTSGSGIEFGTGNFAGLQAALTQKLKVEIVSEPAMLALFGFSLVGLGIASRRRKAA